MLDENVEATKTISFSLKLVSRIKCTTSLSQCELSMREKNDKIQKI